MIGLCLQHHDTLRLPNSLNNALTLQIHKSQRRKGHTESPTLPDPIRLKIGSVHVVSWPRSVKMFSIVNISVELGRIMSVYVYDAESKSGIIGNDRSEQCKETVIRNVAYADTIRFASRIGYGRWTATCTIRGSIIWTKNHLSERHLGDSSRVVWVTRKRVTLIFT